MKSWKCHWGKKKCATTRFTHGCLQALLFRFTYFKTCVSKSKHSHSQAFSMDRLSMQAQIASSPLPNILLRFSQEIAISHGICSTERKLYFFFFFSHRFFSFFFSQSWHWKTNDSICYVYFHSPLPVSSLIDRPINFIGHRPWSFESTVYVSHVLWVTTFKKQCFNQNLTLKQLIPT